MGACSKINMVDFFIFLPFIMEDSFVSVNYFHNCMACNEVSKFLFLSFFPFLARIAYRKGIQDVGDFVSSVEHK